MDTRTVIWVDLQTSMPARDLSAEVGVLCGVWKIREPGEIAAAVRAFSPFVIFFEYDIPVPKLLEPLQRTVTEFPKLPVVMVTEQHSEGLAVWALRTRAWDYLVKPVNRSYLSSRIRMLLDGTISNEPGNEWLPTKPRSAVGLVANGGPVCGERLNVEQSHSGAKEGKRLTPALTFVEANFADKVTLAAVAQLCGLGRYQFSRAFKQEHGTTFREFLIIHRIRKAAQMLQIADTSVTQVAFSVGFNDLSHFAQMFRRYVGVLPSDFVHGKRSEPYVQNSRNAMQQNPSGG